MGNRLAGATSPYLLQHADNPVDWYEWGDEAFAAAARRDVPILLSVGYSACHWCHVMAHESFEDPATARFMNDHFVNVKVDREERPDVDRVYMDAVQAMTGRGGWPMTVFLTPDGRPFFAGTYFPDSDRHGHPSFRRVMAAIVAAWTDRRDQIDDQAERLTAALRRSIPPAPAAPPDGVLSRGFDRLSARFDADHGGFGGAPKFPQAPDLEFLLRAAGRPWAPGAIGMLATTLDAMAAGGIHDHLGGGFARYSVDRRWIVPHFEKMLYDNALLARLYLRAGQVTGHDRFREVAVTTLEYLLRDLCHPDGAFYAAEDADSEGREGTFYVWTRSEVVAAVGPDLDAVALEAFGVTGDGNFEGSNVLTRATPIEEIAARLDTSPGEVSEAIDAARDRLFRARAERVRPDRDDKVITAWNGLAIRCFAEAGAVLDEERYVEAARRAAVFVLQRLRRPEDGRLLRSWRRGRATIPGFAEDHGALALGLLSLYQVDGDPRWADAGIGLLDALDQWFAAPDGGFHATGSDAPQLVARPVNLTDNPTPSDQALAAEASLLAAALTGDARHRDRFDGIVRAAGLLLDRHPEAVGQLLALLATRNEGIREVAVVGSPGDRRALERVVWERFRPGVVVAPGDGRAAAVPLLEDRTAGPGPARAFVCEDFVCSAPSPTPAELRARLAT